MLSKGLIITIIAVYFAVLVLISFLTSRKTTENTFYDGDKKSPWFLVAFGMIGASLSGVTFISVPGWVAGSGFTYMQMVIGYIIGYAIISFVLIPLYYRLNVTSIYEYLGTRFGQIGQKLGASYFLLSRVIGASLRMYLVANVLQIFVFNDLGVPYWVTVVISIALIYLYSFKGGIKTIIWTDTLQTLFMLVSLGITIALLTQEMQLDSVFGAISDAGYGDWFQVDHPEKANYWWKGILAGALLSIAMTGLDQDMMQKNLSCKNSKQAQLNMMSFSVVLFFVNLAFLVLGGLLFLYINSKPELMSGYVELGEKTDNLFPYLALKGGLGIGVGVFFLLGLIASAYSSADSALTSLTTSFSLDILNLRSKTVNQKKTRTIIHISFALLIAIVIIICHLMDLKQNVISNLFTVAGYTYGPMLGIFMFGIITKRSVNQIALLVISIVVPVALYLCTVTFKDAILGDYQLGHVVLGINGILTFVFLLIFSNGKMKRTA